MDLTTLTALTPLDGRYRRAGDKLAPYFSEFGLIKYRVKVEIEWLKALAAEPAIAEVPAFSVATLAALDAVAADFSLADAQAVKDHEKTTNHDVKAVEYFLKDRLAGNVHVTRVSEFIHFSCTSEDINNLSHALMLRDAARNAQGNAPVVQITSRGDKIYHDIGFVRVIRHRKFRGIVAPRRH